MKKIILGFALLSIFMLFSCAKENNTTSNELKDNMIISDFSNYKSTIESSNSIFVEYANDYTGSFTISDASLASEIKNYILTATYTKEEFMTPGANISLKFDDLTINSDYIYYKGYFFKSSNGNNINDSINKYALDNNLITAK